RGTQRLFAAYHSANFDVVVRPAQAGEKRLDVPAHFRDRHSGLAAPPNRQACASMSDTSVQAIGVLIIPPSVRRASRALALKPAIVVASIFTILSRSAAKLPFASTSRLFASGRRALRSAVRLRFAHALTRTSETPMA